MSHQREHDRTLTILSVLCGLLLVSNVALWAYGYYEIKNLKTDLATLTDIYTKKATEFTDQISQAHQIIDDLQTELGLTTEELNDLEDDYEREREKNAKFEDQIRDITGTVADLDKLSKTDEELLQKYSRVYFLNENYVPSDLSKIDKDYILEGRNEQYFHSDAMKFLDDMIDDARDDDVDLFVVSAYRSFDEQTELKNGYTVTYGSGANTFSADQGYSEHQLGTTVDLTVPQIGGAYSSFASTDAYQWLLKNAYRYGFILSYPEGNSYYVFEPWHWRFVGKELAKDLHRDDESFYDLDQRQIDKYLIDIFDN